MPKAKKPTMDYKKFIEENIIDCDISYRGGSLKVDASSLFFGIDDAVVGAYQNYLGGGIGGAIVGAAMFDPEELSEAQRVVFEELLEACKVYFYNTNNGGGDDYMQEEVTGKAAGGYKKNQAMPVSAY